MIADDLGEPLQDLCQFVGKATNNEAEYRALIEGLKAVSKWKPDRLEIYLDSKLVVEQIKGKYKIKEPRLQVLHGEAKQLFDEFPNASIEYVERERNKRADALANKAIDDKVKKSTTPGLT